MGVETALFIAAGASLASAGLSVAGGLRAQSESERQAAEAIRQGKLAAQEAEIEAERREEEIDKFKSQQLVGFLKSGVQIAGTPEEVLAETERLGAEEVAAIRRSGLASQSAFGSQARQLQASGRQQLLSGIASGVGSVGRGFGSAAQAGGF